MREANFPETQQLEQMQASAAAHQGDEIRGQRGLQADSGTVPAPGECYAWSCGWFTAFWYCVGRL
jgi:hypothetical protein